MTQESEKARIILEAIMAYASLDFSKKIDIEIEKDSTLDAIAAGVNMLGEELRENTLSLQEKEKVIKEIHHRVKNNMQVVISMMKLQTIDESDPRILSFVQDCQSRINAMALVHEMLYNSESLQHNNFYEYADFLFRSLFMSYAPPGHSIEREINVDEYVSFHIDQMIPIGLVINELVTNSLKHAFPENIGKIRLTAFVKERMATVIYEDDGVGIEKSKKNNNRNGFGLQLVEMLNEQLDGELIMSHENGLSFQFSFAMV